MGFFLHLRSRPLSHLLPSPAGGFATWTLVRVTAESLKEPVGKGGLCPALGGLGRLYVFCMPYAVARVSIHTLKCSQRGGRQCCQAEAVSPEEIEEVRKGSAISGRACVESRGPAISHADQISVLRERRNETKKKSLGFLKFF